MSFDIQVLVRAVECVTAFFLIGLLGYWLSKKGWFSQESASMLTRLVTSIVIPINLLYTINTSTNQEQFLPLLHYMLLPAAAILIVMALAAGLAKAVGMERSHRNIFITAASCSNTINIGLPINLALFGTDSLPAILIYYMGNTVVFWTIGNCMLASDAGPEARCPVVSLETVRRIFSPPLLAFLIGLALLIVNVKIPPLLTIAGGQVAGMTTPLSIICIGIAIWQTGLKNIRFSRDVCLIALGRFVVSPAILLCILHFFPVPELMRNVFIIQCSLPPMSNIALLAMRYKADAGFASIAISLCTLCALVTVPIFMVLLNIL